MVITCPGICEIRVDLNKTRYLKSQHIQTLIHKGTKGKGPAPKACIQAEEEQITLVPKAKYEEKQAEKTKMVRTYSQWSLSLYQ